MQSTRHSHEANAAERFMRATRDVDVAFRLVRGETDHDSPPLEHAQAIRQLERALDELARAQELFDSAVGGPARAGNRKPLRALQTAPRRLRAVTSS